MEIFLNNKKPQERVVVVSTAPESNSMNLLTEKVNKGWNL